MTLELASKSVSGISGQWEGGEEAIQEGNRTDKDIKM